MSEAVGRAKLWQWWVVAGVLAIAAQKTLPPDGLAANLAYNAIGLASTIGILVGVRLHRPSRPSVWYLFAAGQAASVLGDVVWEIYFYVLHQEPYPSLADVFYLASYPLLAAGLTGSLVLLAGALLVAGMATAPTMVTTMTLVQRYTPEDRLNEGMTLAVTGLLGGIACGSAAGGWTVEHASATAGYGVPVAAAAIALLVALCTFVPFGPSNRAVDSLPTH